MPTSALLLAAHALLALPAAAAPQDALPRRIRLFDRMDRATFSDAGAAPSTSAEKPSVRTLGFEAASVRKLWFARAKGRDSNWESDPWRFATLLPDGGVHGGALRIGPGLEDDVSFVSLLVPVRPLTRYVLRGRVRLVDHPAADEASAREVVRVIEHAGVLADPTTITRFSPSILEVHRGSREHVDGDWDRFELEIPLTHAGAGSFEIRLLHRSGGSKAAASSFDDVELEETPMSEADLWKLLIARWQPNDGVAAAIPWRLRVTLTTADGVKEETRDAVLLAPPRTLSIPVTLPPAATLPLLRFAYGMLPEAFAIPGDGARLDVAFVPTGGSAIELGRLDFDPKNDAAQQCWLHARIDLTKVAGQSGELVFSSSDVGERDLIDAVVIATPRIEPAAPEAKLPADGPTHGFNVLVMASDTLRADRLSAFGYGRPTSPNLVRLAQHGVRFTRTRSQAPWTLPSFSSIMTSMYPSEHGAGRGGRDEWTPLDPGVTTLADVLARVGYETAGITANHLISPEYGLDQGFESYAIPGMVEWQKLGMESVDLDAPLVVRFLEEHTQTPFFLFWHMMDPHLPYTTQAAIRAQFTDPAYDGRFKGDDPTVPFQVLDPRPGRRWFTQEGPPKPPPLTDADRKFVSDYYDSEICEIDRAIGTVLDALQSTGMWERTIVAMIADHGEGLGEHGHYHHGYTLFEDQVHIPMIVRVPGRAEDVAISVPASSIDLAPTILAALGLSAPETFRGVDRLAAKPDAEPVYLEYPSYDSSAQKGVILGDFKYLHDPWFHTEALYDTVSDPLERADVKSAHPDIVAKGRALLDEFRWQKLQQGRFHVRVRGQAGAKLRIAVSTDDLFDANFATRPLIDERDFKLDFDRRQLILETTMTGERVELVCWCRGEKLAFDVQIDGKPIEGGIRVGDDPAARPSPLALGRAEVPTLAGERLEPPRPLQALIWMEHGAGNVKPIVPTPEEADVLRALGYAH